jgi:hypothetical protein
VYIVLVQNPKAPEARVIVVDSLEVAEFVVLRLRCSYYAAEINAELRRNPGTLYQPSGVMISSHLGITSEQLLREIYPTALLLPSAVCRLTPNSTYERVRGALDPSHYNLDACLLSNDMYADAVSVPRY